MITLATMIRDTDDVRAFELLKASLKDDYIWLIATAPGIKVPGICYSIVRDDIAVAQIELGRIAIAECGYYAYVSPRLIFLNGNFIDLGNYDVVSEMRHPRFESNTIGMYSTDLFVIRWRGLLDVWAEFHRQKLWSGRKSFEYALQGRTKELIDPQHNVGPWRQVTTKGGRVICDGLEVESYLGLDPKFRSLLEASNYPELNEKVRKYYGPAANSRS